MRCTIEKMAIPGSGASCNRAGGGMPMTGMQCDWFEKEAMGMRVAVCVSIRSITFKEEGKNAYESDCRQRESMRFLWGRSVMEVS